MSCAALFVSGFPADVSVTALTDLFEEVGPTVRVDLTDKSSAVVVYKDMKDCERVGALEIGGVSLQVIRGRVPHPLRPTISPVRSTLGPNQKPLDVLIVRGRKTSAAIGAAYRAAVAGTQVFALWDQKCAKSSCDLRLSRYDAHSSLASEREDLKVRDQAMEVSVGATPRCALLQVVSDTLPRAEEFKDGPVHHPAEVTAMMNDNHIESISASVASTVYATWLQHVRGCAFALLPHNTESWSNDIAGANMAVHRLVYGNATCSIEGHGAMVGLQLVHKFGEVNAGLVHGAMVSFMDKEEEQKRYMAGRTIFLGPQLQKPVKYLADGTVLDHKGDIVRLRA